ncbi:hypothetical protein CY34DRAFT_591663 [Suillus luteus UH-Slu-Lm8-n1]|uniref:Uncharacterized protein n=1 Tax=Suillus luteus UH-Slu-Lm8-n1 TaxID=930992 RepID=A0A0D0AB02_9AGAM|nr:hypothetical protein CY34DRAFT_591663 [Suillus luteus UH-Slu-Lm8-n1]
MCKRASSAVSHRSDHLTRGTAFIALIIYTHQIQDRPMRGTMSKHGNALPCAAIYYSTTSASICDKQLATSYQQDHAIHKKIRTPQLFCSRESSRVRRRLVAHAKILHLPRRLVEEFGDSNSSAFFVLTQITTNRASSPALEVTGLHASLKILESLCLDLLTSQLQVRGMPSVVA